MKLIKKLENLEAVPFSHSVLTSYLNDYKNPNDKIRQMIKQGELIRIKQSLYVLGDLFRNKSISRELLANLIYGPSYVSMDYALSLYGLIPERVYEVTSVTTKMAKEYTTPFGRFSYVKSPIAIYPIGITLKENRDGTTYMVASPEKALCDKVLFTKKLDITSVKMMKEYLMDDLRIDMNELQKFDTGIIKQCANSRYKNRLMEYLYRTIKKIGGSFHA